MEEDVKKKNYDSIYPTLMVNRPPKVGPKI